MLRDFWFALRLLARDRWYTAVAIGTLAVGIGLTTTVFTLVDAVLLRGLPVRDADRLFAVSTEMSGGMPAGVSLADLDDWRTGATSFSDLAAFTINTVNLSGGPAPPQPAHRASVTVNLFALLGQAPAVGRDFAPGEDGPQASRVAIISHRLWTTRFGSRPATAGQVVRVDAEPYTIIGIMPPGMEFPADAEIWTPAVTTTSSRALRTFAAAGRLRDGVSLATARAEMDTLASRLSQAYPETNRDFAGIRIETFNERFTEPRVRTVFVSMMGAAGCVLLIACANAASLLLSRSLHRSRDVAVRLALGARRGRIVRQQLVESLIVSGAAGLCGLAVAAGAVRIFDRAVAGTGKPYWIVFSLDPMVFAFAAAICLLTAVMSGVAPVLHLTGVRAGDALKEGGRGAIGGHAGRWTAAALVIAELTLTMVLMIGAGLMARSFLSLYRFQPGIDTSGLLTMKMELPAAKYPSATARRAFFDRLLPALAATPGITAVAATTSVPASTAPLRGFQIDGRILPAPAGEEPRTAVVTVTPDFFATVGVHLLRGSGFTSADHSSSTDALIVNARFVADFMGTADPIGQRIRLSGLPRLPGAAAIPPEPWRTIVGVAPTLRHASPQEPDAPPAVYLPYASTAPSYVTLLVRSRLEAGSVVATVRARVQAIDPDQPVFAVQTVDQQLARQRWPYRVFGALFAVFAIVALVMSAVGLYAVLSYAVERRTAEIGVRMALGASAFGVSRLVLASGMRQLAVGMTLGLVAAAFLSRVLGSLLVGVTPRDPVTFAAVPIFLAAVAVAASLLPARRAARLNPLELLRAG